MLKRTVPDGLFEKALGYARNKQDYIYNKEKRSVVLEDWYLIQLTKEYVIALEFSRFTEELCRKLNMEKEHSASSMSAPTDVHIVAVPAL